MGFTPAEVDACSLWQFQAALSGWCEANGAGASETMMTDEEFAAAEAALEEGPRTQL